MFISNKKVSETPLEMLDRLRIEKPEIKDEKLSYAGRLDPMAEGEVLILVGEENKEYQKYLEYDKEYLATFIVGMHTDTGDVLGLIENQKILNITEDELIGKVFKLKEIKEQKYPWFSSKTIGGIKLFDHFKKGNTNIERPSRDVSIMESEFLNLKSEPTANIKNYINDNVSKVKGDFRQNEILEKWREYFDSVKDEKIQTFQIKLKVGSGTYIRGLTENFGFPVTLIKLNRTKIFI